MFQQSKAMTWAGWILTAFIGFMLIVVSAGSKLQGADEVQKQMVGFFGYPESTIKPIGIAEAICAVLFVIPQTAVLGAVLLTGYLGGAVASHVRVSDGIYGPVIGGVLVWLALFLRDPRIRALLPLRRSAKSTESA